MGRTFTIPQKNVSGTKYHSISRSNSRGERDDIWICPHVSFGFTVCGGYFLILGVMQGAFRKKQSTITTQFAIKLIASGSGKVRYCYQCIPAWTRSGRDVRLCDVALASPFDFVASPLLPTWLGVFSALLAFGMMTIGRSFSANTYCRAIAFLFEATHQHRYFSSPEKSCSFLRT
jgi:hypothetical protein